LNTTGLTSLHAQVSVAAAHHIAAPQAQAETLDLVVIRDYTGNTIKFSMQVTFPKSTGIKEKVIPVEVRTYDKKDPETSVPFFDYAKYSPTFLVFYDKKPGGPDTGYYRSQEVTPAVKTPSPFPPEINKYIRENGNVWAIIKLDGKLEMVAR
jgi:hypothetical protein